MALGCDASGGLCRVVVNGPPPRGTKTSPDAHGEIRVCERCMWNYPEDNRCDICKRRTMYACSTLGATPCCDQCAASLADYARTAMLGDIRIGWKFRAWLDAFGLSGRSIMPSTHDREARLLIQSYMRDSEIRLSNHELYTIRAKTRLREMGCPYDLAADLIRVLGPENVPNNWVDLARYLVNKIGSGYFS